MYNKDIRQRVAGAKTINTLVDTFKLAHHCLLELKKYKGLVYNDELPITEMNQITDTLTNTKIVNRSKTTGKDLQNKTNKSYIFWGNCWKCDKLGHSAKECHNNSVTANQDQTVVTTFKNTHRMVCKTYLE